MAEPRRLKLQSPAYGDAIYYKWPLVVTKKLDEPTEIAETIRLVCEDFPELKYAVENVILKDYDANDYDSMNQLCQRYNKAIRNILSLWKGRAPPPRMFQPPNKELLRHIVNLCFSHAIKEPEKLNLYEPFSPEVYGETSFDMIDQILEEVQVSNDQVFLDLGSGVGQVVLQAAASNLFKECIGVEKSETPAEFAKLMEVEFKKWMDWFGKTYTDFTLEKGDFLDEKWKDMINDVGVVFVNNFAFGPVVNHHLKTRFQTMKEGSKVISSREFVPLNFKFNKRNLSELGAMIRVSEIKPKSEEATVSWTGNTVSYYLHIVDRTRLEKYFSILKKKKEGQDLDEDEMSLCSESNNSLDTSGTPLDIETLEENLDDLYLGTTTRHQWQLLTETINQSKQDAKVMPGREAKTRGRIKLTQQQAIVRKATVEQQALIRKAHAEQQALIRKASAQQQSLIKKSTAEQKSLARTTQARRSSGKLQMTNKILQKYGHQKLKKKQFIASLDIPADSDNSPAPASPKVKHTRTNNNINKKKDCGKDSKENNNLLNVKEKNILNAKERRKILKAKENKNILNMKENNKVPKGKCQIKKMTPHQTHISKSSETLERNTSKPVKDDDIEKEIDKFLVGMKVKYMDFIKRINMKEYAERLKVMIECETAKKKLLTREISETERMVQNLISDSLRNFSSRLVELDLAVKTPLDLLSKSSVLAEKHQQLENKVVNMEIEVFNLEEKYKNLCAARDHKNRKLGLEPMIDSDTDEIIHDDTKLGRKKELETKLCGAILTALNHRRSLIDQQSSLTEQISILEKISHTDGEHSADASADCEEKEAVKMEEKIRPKPRPVAFVPPRMLSENKKNTISPETQVWPTENETNRRPRGRNHKQSKASDEQHNSPSTQSDSSQGSKTELDDRVPPTTDENEISAGLNGIATSISPQISTSDQSYVTYQAQEQRAPIVFPNNLIGDISGNSVKSAKQFLKTSGKLLNAANNKWGTFQEVSHSRPYYSNRENHPTITNTFESFSHAQIKELLKPVLTDTFPNKPCSGMTKETSGGNVSSSFHKKNKRSKKSFSENSCFSVDTKAVFPGDGSHSSSNFSLPINSLLSPNSSQLETSGSNSTTLSVNSYVSLITGNTSSAPEIKTKSCVSPIYDVAVCSVSNTINVCMSDDTKSVQDVVDESVKQVQYSNSHQQTKIHLENRLATEQIENLGVSNTNNANVNFENWLQNSSTVSLHRNHSSAWTSSTFSISQLQPPNTSKKSKNDISPLSQLMEKSKMVSISTSSNNNNLQNNVLLRSITSNTNLQENVLLSSSKSDAQICSPEVIGRDSLARLDNSGEANKHYVMINKPSQSLDNSHQPVVSDIQVGNSQSLSIHGEEKPKVKKKKGRPKSEAKKVMDEIAVKNAINRYHYPFAMLQSENIANARTLPDVGMKRMHEESGIKANFRQFTNPDVEDHFRTTFNKFCQNSNRESINSILEKVKMPKTSCPYPSVPGSTSPSVFNSVSIGQAPLYMGHHFIPPSEVITTNPSSKLLDVSGVCSSESNIVNDKPIPYPRGHRDVPENPHVGRSIVSTSIGHSLAPIFDKNNVSSVGLTILPGASATALYCPSTMKLLKNNFDSSKVTPSSLLIPAKGNPNDIPSNYPPRMQSFPPASKNPSESSIIHQETVNKPREMRKPNPDMFLNPFSGGTFIPPTVPGGHPTFIPLPNMIAESNVRPTADSLLRPSVPKRSRGRKPKQTIKELSSATSSMGAVDHGTMIDFSKAPSHVASVPRFNTPGNNMINAGFRPPVIRNAMPPDPASLKLSLDVRGGRPMLRPRITNVNTDLHPPVSNKMIPPRAAVPKGSYPSTEITFQNRNPYPVMVSHPQTPSPGSPTYNNHPRFLLLNMPTVMMVPNPGGNINENNQVLQRQHSMTSPTFPPPNS